MEPDAERAPAGSGWRRPSAVIFLSIATAACLQQVRRRQRRGFGEPLAKPDDPADRSHRAPARLNRTAAWKLHVQQARSSKDAKQQDCEIGENCSIPQWDTGSAQQGEDLAVFMGLFYESGRALHGGIFAEVGALDGTLWSNTWMLEKKVRWRGVLIEGCPDMAKLIPEKRPLAIAVQKAVCHAPHKFVKYAGECGPAAGLEAILPAHLAQFRYKKPACHQHRVRRGNKAYLVTSCHPASERPAPIRVPCGTMTKLLLDVDIDCLDFLSIDVEGFEYGLLTTINFTQITIRTLVIEMDSVEEKRAIADLLLAAGYEHWAFVGVNLNNQIWRLRGHENDGLPCRPDRAAWRPVKLPPGFPMPPNEIVLPGHIAYHQPVLLLRAGQPVLHRHHMALARLKRPSYTEYVLSFSPKGRKPFIF
eukprot:TRINITY_DN3160_c0_g1_i3.p1 TRINITY_DN3160_c0_g1~~TRINITY_DN3160_c0_g1_i3.p1  ORF type:complete len:419 (+),score=16.75 TRINITY_DN3160_c0_g1_i3:76-1332(+)